MQRRKPSKQKCIPENTISELFVAVSCVFTDPYDIGVSCFHDSASKSSRILGLSPSLYLNEECVRVSFVWALWRSSPNLVDPRILVHPHWRSLEIGTLHIVTP